jgi:hypothetical protein
MKWPSSMWSSLWLLAACAVGTRAAVEADPEMKSVAVSYSALHRSANGCMANDTLQAADT